MASLTVTLKVLSFLKSIYRRGFLPAENRLKSLLAFNVKIKRSTLKYFIAEEALMSLHYMVKSVGEDTFSEIGERRCKIGDLTL